MLTYKLYQNKIEGSKTYQQWYARTVQNEMFDLDKLSKHMSKHNTPFSAGTIKAIITDMVNCITELALEGKSVKIPNLGIFWIGIEGSPAVTADKWNVAANVSNVRLRCRPTGDARPIVLNIERELTEAEDYTSEKKKAKAASSSGSTKTQG